VQDYRRTVIWQNTETYKEGNVAEVHVFPVSIVGIVTWDEPLEALRSLQHI
jgi:hypothetical protein